MSSGTVLKDSQKKAEFSPNSGADPVLGPSLGADAAHRLTGLVRFGRFVLDLDRGCLRSDEGDLALRPKTFNLLLYFVAHPGRLLSKNELLTAVWPKVIVSEDSLVQCIAELRRALSDHDHRLIKTVPRRGYRFEAALVHEPDGPARPDAPGQDGGDRLAGPRGTIARSHRLVLAAIGVLALLVATSAGFWWYGAGSDPPDAPALSIVVLPFKSLASDPAQSSLAEGIANDLTADLSRLPNLFVIAQATARTFRGDHVDARRIGRALNVRYVLDGRVAQTDDHLRINAELVSAETGAALWAERFESARHELPQFREEIIGRIATSLNFRLTRLESQRALRERRDDPRASDLTTRGWALVYAGKTPTNYEAARALFRQAVARDPVAVNALAGIGWTSAIMVLDGWSKAREVDIAAADSAVTKALAIDRNHVVTHHVRGFLHRLHRRSEAARDTFRTVVGLSPNFAPGHAQLAITELELGRPEGVFTAVEKAMRLSPRDPSLGPWLAFVGMAELHRGNPEEAIGWLRRAIDTGTPVARHKAYLASALALAGRENDARTALAAFRKARPSATITSLRASARSVMPDFVAQQERLFEGLRIAGLPE